MRVGIDASNIRAGGGITHLQHLLQYADPVAHGFESVVLWSCHQTLARIADRPWLHKRHDAALEKGYLRRAMWQRMRLGSLLRAEGCDVLFAPGGTIGARFGPAVTMSRNMLPFEWRELRRYGFSATGLRLMLLRLTQSHSFRTAAGVIFLTQYARTIVSGITGHLAGATAVIPHGVDVQFSSAADDAGRAEPGAHDSTFSVLYVSIIDVYKHQPEVAEAIALLRASGLPVSVTFAGPAYPPSLKSFEETIRRVDPEGVFVRYLGNVAHHDLPALYARANVCVFASSCENMPNILLEAMASGRAIACSDRGPMPEVLGDAGVYFDPESPASIATAVRTLLAFPEKRKNCAALARERALQYSWQRCTQETFAFLAKVLERERAEVTAA